MEQETKRWAFILAACLALALLIVGGVLLGVGIHRVQNPLTVGLVATVLEQHETRSLRPQTTHIGKSYTTTYIPTVDCYTTVSLAPGIAGTTRESVSCSRNHHSAGELVPVCHSEKSMQDFVISQWDSSHGTPVPMCGRGLQSERDLLIAGIVLCSCGVALIVAATVICCIIPAVVHAFKHLQASRRASRRIADSSLEMVHG